MFEEATRILNQRFPFFTTHVLNIGRPTLDPSIPTACVSVKKGKGSTEFQYRFNPAFAASLSPEDRAFVMAHETMHVLRNDLSVVVRGDYEDKMRLNKAMDCIINDTLIDAGFKRPAIQGCFGPDMIGENCKGKTIAEVYAKLEQEEQEQDESDGEGGGGEATEDKPDPTTEPFDSHDWDEDDADAADAKQDPACEKDLTGGDYNHPGHPVNEADFARFDWNLLFSMLDKELVDKPGLGPQFKADWRRPRRQAMGLIGKTNLPSQRDNPMRDAYRFKKPQVCVFIDNSGSTTQPMRAAFREVCKRLPRDRAEYFFVVVDNPAWQELPQDFDFENSPLPLPYKDHPQGGGDWLANAPWVCVEAEMAEDWIQTAIESGKLRQYPKSVLFISDVLTCNVCATPENAARWLVLHNTDENDASLRTWNQYTYEGRRSLSHTWRSEHKGNNSWLAQNKAASKRVPEQWTMCRLRVDRIFPLRHFIR